MPSIIYRFAILVLLAQLAACSSDSKVPDGGSAGPDAASADAQAADGSPSDPNRQDARDVSSPGYDGAVKDAAATSSPYDGAPIDGMTSSVDGMTSSVDGMTSSVDGATRIDAPAPSPDGPIACGAIGALCSTSVDCCGLACVAGRCSASACLSDGVACSVSGECCSTLCGAGGTCSPLNTACKTAGNACTTGSECCNGVCDANHQCATLGAVSFCAQTGDVCRQDSECCTGVCQTVAGAAVGTCAAIATSCQVDGTVCNGCGSCCSHFCGPYGAGGPSICQPASGCHVQGDLCHQDSDCCGGDVSSGLPGAGLIKCEPDPVYGARIGTCGSPKASNCSDGSSTCKNACNPEGNVCHYKTTLVCSGSLTNVRNDCCDCISGKECCQPDATGIPRCNSLAACVPAGGNCAFSGECCDHEPCLPDPTTGSLRCGSTCVAAGNVCTTNADCCAGMVCQTAPGSVAGTCLIPNPPSSGPDGGIDAPPVCSYYGQACSVTSPCCGASCVNDMYEPCTAADTGCICFNPE
jgi:hypothetical protein